MRCTKCGNISWDNMRICNACGQDLSEQIDPLGHFPQPKPGFSWFDGIMGTKATTGKKMDSPVDLSDIDVSDLLHKEEAAHPVEGEVTPDDIGLDLDELDEIVEDEDLQKILDKTSS